MVCECLVELTHVFLDKTFTYLVPKELENSIKIGMRVEVPFGKQILEGFVMSISKSIPNDIELKSIISLVDSYPVLNKELMDLGKFVQKTTLSSLMSSYAVMLPKALKAKKKVSINVKMEKYIELNEIDLNNIKLNDSQRKIVNVLKEKKRVKKKQLSEISVSSVNTLLKKNILKETEEEVYRYNIEEKEKKDFSLNDEQLKVYSFIVNNINESKTYLLHGVTGSGKTNVYMKLIENVIKQGKKALFLVPEISLTPQIINRFTSYFNRIAVLHSKLSDTEKYDEWRKINENKVDIVIGARSAVFAPLDDIGIIIIDEEHSSTYKQENNPRYNAIDIAKCRSKYHNCPLVLGSATPSMESYARAKNGTYTLLELNNRYNGMNPNIEIIDMNEEYRKTNDYFSETLINNVKETISKGEQVILFLNKRGYSSVVTCSNCGYTEKCPNCDITMTYHKTSNMLRCHYCGYAKRKEKECSSCGAFYKEYGLGTEKVEETLQMLIPESKIIRMDIDTTTKKNAHENIIKSFASGKYNILLGTQMIAKGLDFENVTLVGVINADISLNFPDFRSSEVTFELLNQVSGRSGRGHKKGKVLIQTFNPNHYAIKYSKDNDYKSFYTEELGIRKKLNYPPFCYICLIRIISKDYNNASKMSYKIGDYLKDKVKNETILGPSTSNIFKLNNDYRFQIIIKYKDINNIRKYLYMLQERFFNDKTIRLEIDFNPIKL